MAGRLASRLSLEKNGLVFVEHKTKVTDFFDENQVKSIYYREIEQLIRRQSGASRVVIFDHALRSGDERGTRGKADPQSGSAGAQ